MNLRHRTSEPLPFVDVEGIHMVERTWWIDLGYRWGGRAYRLEGPLGKVLVEFSDTGRLHVHAGYLWDGSSGPTKDGKPDPTPSLVHDVKYEAMRRGRLSRADRKRADDLYHALLREYGMGGVRAWGRWFGLRLFGFRAASRNRGGEYKHRTQQ